MAGLRLATATAVLAKNLSFCRNDRSCPRAIYNSAQGCFVAIFPEPNRGNLTGNVALEHGPEFVVHARAVALRNLSGNLRGEQSLIRGFRWQPQGQ